MFGSRMSCRGAHPLGRMHRPAFAAHGSRDAAAQAPAGGRAGGRGTCGVSVREREAVLPFVTTGLHLGDDVLSAVSQTGRRMLETSSACESEANETNTDLLGTGRRWPSGAGLWGQLCSLGCRGAAGAWPSTPHSTPHSSQQLLLRPGHTPSRQHDLEAANSAACAPARHPPRGGY